MKFDLLSIFKAAPPEPKKPTMGEMSFADPSRLFPGGYSLPYNPSELVGQRGLGVFDKMRRDDQVKAALTFKRHTVTAAGWSIKVPEGKDEDWDAAVLCREALDKLDGSLERAIDGVLTALAYGYSISEKVWEERDSQIVIKALKTRRPHDWEFEVDVYGNLIGLKQLQRKLPVDKFVVYSYDSEFGNWYGTSDLEAAHRAWWTKRNTYQWMAMLLERLGIPPIFALYDPNAYQGAKIGDLKNVLKNMQAATVGVIPRASPEDLELWTTEIKNGIEGVFIPALDRLDRDISKALLMPGLLGMTADAEQGSMARAKVHFDVFMLVTERTRNEIAQHVISEQLIKPMVDLNFGAMDEYPWFEFNPLTDEIRTDIMTTWGTLTGQKVVTSTVDDERHVRTLLQFPELSPEGEAMRKEREEAETAQRDATTAGMQATAAMTPEQRAKEKAKDPKKFAEEDGVWRTINGRKVFIRDGEDPTVAVARDKSAEELAAFESKIAGEKVEHLQAWDSDGNPLLGPDGVTQNKADGVTADAKLLRKARDGVVSHNHPNGSLMPSDGDVLFAAQIKVREIRVVTKAGVLGIERPEAGWPTKARLAKLYDKHYLAASVVPGVKERLRFSGHITEEFAAETNRAFASAFVKSFTAAIGSKATYTTHGK
jgi:phage gp29-like protein